MSGGTHHTRWVGAAALAVLAALAIVLVLQLRGSDEPVRQATAAEAPGAAALTDPQHRDTTWSRIDHVDAMRPLPADAKDDRPAFYDDGSGCQVKDGDPVPKVCASGDPSGDRTLMLVGDSKLAQWQTAFDDLGRADGFTVLTATKSACPFTDAAVTSDRKVRTDCREWGQAALRDTLEARPDVVVTSQRTSTALLDDGSDRTRGAMIRGLHSYWSQLQDAGIEVVVMLDNPFPITHPVYQCVEEHPDDLPRCSFDLAEGVQKSSAPMMREAAEIMSGVGIIDMTSTICPDEGRCPAVIGNVLVYRAGSHITKTFVRTAEPQLAVELARATGGTFGETGP